MEKFQAIKETRMNGKFLSIGFAAALALLASLSGNAGGAETREVADSHGRMVRIPASVTRVAPTIPAFAQMTEMLTRGGGKIVALPTEGISSYFRHVFPDLERSNPRNYASDSLEDIIASGAQVVFGPRIRFSDEQRNMLRATGIPVVDIDNIQDVKGLSQSFLIIGRILGEEESARAEEFVRYYQGNMAEAARRTAALPPSARPKVMLLSSTGGALSTPNRNDVSNEYITAAGGVNVAADHLPAGGMSAIADTESIIGWNPDYIIATNRPTRDDILADAALASVAAIKNGRVAICPSGIFLWSVRSGEGAMMPLWLGTIINPELFADIDMRDVVRNFFRDFYQYEVSDEEIKNILAGGTGRSGGRGR